MIEYNREINNNFEGDDEEIEELERDLQNKVGECMPQVLEVFPDILPEYAEEIVKRYIYDDDKVDKIISEIGLMEGNYPKKEGFFGIAKNNEGKNDYSNYSTIVSDSYKKFSISFVVSKFPKYNLNFTLSVMKAFNFHLYPSWIFLYSLQKKIEEEERIESKEEELGEKFDVEFENDVDGTDIKIEEIIKIPQDLLKINSKYVNFHSLHFPYKLDPLNMEEFFDEEIEEAEVLLRRIDERQEKRKKYFEYVVNTKKGKEGYFLGECPICYKDGIMGEKIVCCRKGHDVCENCLKEQIVSMIKTNDSKLKCIAEKDCEEGYTEEVIRKVLDEETYNKFEEMLASSDITMAKLPVVNCPFCHYGEYVNEQIQRELDEDLMALDTELAERMRRELLEIRKELMKETHK